MDIMNALVQKPFVSQRELADRTGYSLGAVNKSLQLLQQEGYIDGVGVPTEKAVSMVAERKPHNAVILAAGYGMRMVPINTEMPKGLLTVYGEPLIERLICQLQEVGIFEIYIVVGFMKEQYEYLIDKYGVHLIVNPEYATKNNLHSLLLAEKHLSNTYVIPCDIWCEKNPFRTTEIYSWYMVTDKLKASSTVRVNRKKELVMVGDNGNNMIGVSYLMGQTAREVRNRLKTMDADPACQNAFWEDTLCGSGKWLTAARVTSASEVIEINTYEQLRMLDENSDQLKTDAIGVICRTFHAQPSEITDITVLKKGMTNRSFLFRCKEKRYIMRIPGEGTDALINRVQEANVYQTITGLGICDDIVYIDPSNGYKITEFLDDARVCDAENEQDLRQCMARLRAFHDQRLSVEHTFDIFERIDFYESLWGTIPSVYADYQQTKKNVLSLRKYIDAHKEAYVLTHIDAVPDNFLFAAKDTDIRLIDWEYAGMQDPHVDIAMFCIYSLYERNQVDQLIDLYFTEGCTEEKRVKIYCYIAACGLLWSNWCEYKRNLGVEFGEYSLRQYRYAKEYYRIVSKALNGKETK